MAFLHELHLLILYLGAGVLSEEVWQPYVPHFVTSMASVDAQRVSQERLATSGGADKNYISFFVDIAVAA